MSKISMTVMQAEQAAVRAKERALAQEEAGNEKEARYARKWEEWWKGRVKALAKATAAKAEAAKAETQQESGT